MQPDPECQKLLPASLPNVAKVPGVPSLMPLVSFGTLIIGSSAVLINCNSYIMERFPFPVALVFFHCFSSSVLAGMLFMACPSLFPALSDADRKGHFDIRSTIRLLLPIALLFAVSLTLGNAAFIYSSVSFLQMMKEGNVVLVFAISLLFGVEKMSSRELFVLLFIIIATVATIKGELRFSDLGFQVQLACCFTESLKTVVQGVALANSRLDPFSFILTMMPLCTLILGALMTVHLAIVNVPFVDLPQMHHFQGMGVLLAFNALLSFACNIFIAFFMKYSTAMSFVVCNICKDIAIVAGSFIMTEDPISALQWVGFSAQLGWISLWYSMKMFSNTSLK